MDKLANQRRLLMLHVHTCPRMRVFVVCIHAFFLKSRHQIPDREALLSPLCEKVHRQLELLADHKVNFHSRLELLVPEVDVQVVCDSLLLPTAPPSAAISAASTRNLALDFHLHPCIFLLLLLLLRLRVRSGGCGSNDLASLLCKFTTAIQ